LEVSVANTVVSFFLINLDFGPEPSFQSVNEVGWSGGLDLSPPGGAASIDFAVTRANEHKLSQANAARRGPARRFPCRREKFGEVRLSVAWERIEECNSSGQGGPGIIWDANKVEERWIPGVGDDALGPARE